jgi:protein-export membrane protein SecD
MKKRTALPLALVMIAAVTALFALTPFAQGSPSRQDVDATALQGTVDALVQQRFQQTQQAMGPFLTATYIIQSATQTAQAAVDAQAAATTGAQATANFQATIDAAFSNALTATALGPQPTATITPAPITSVQVVYQASNKADKDDLNDAANIIKNRLKGQSISNTSVKVDSKKHTITVTLPPLANQAEIIASLRQTGMVEFVDFQGLIDKLNDFVGKPINTTQGDDRDWAEESQAAAALNNPGSNKPFQTVVSGERIDSAKAIQSPNNPNDWVVQFTFDDKGSGIMMDYSESHIGQPMAIVLDGVVVSIPVIQGQFGDNGGLISGNFTESAARLLALQLDFGALPISLKVASTTTVSADGTAQVAVVPTATITPGPSPTIDPRPTETVGKISVAEEVFEHGRMFWVSPTQQFWVMVITSTGHGTWSIFDDTFKDGEPEMDPSIVAPDGKYQPVRGFGKLWRENQTVRDELGWGTTPEFGYDSEYRYYPGGSVQNGQYVAGPGYHVLFTLDGEAIRFNEADMTWELYKADS